MPARIFQIYALMVMLAGVGVLMALHVAPGGLSLGGQVSLLHRAWVAEIARGGAGQAQPSALSALRLALGLGGGQALLLAVAGQGVAVWLLAGALGPAVAGRPASAVVGAPLLVQAVDGFALPLAGMEGAWLVAASVAVLVGLSRAAKGPVPGFLLPAVLLVPALRVEGAALTLAAVIALLSLGHRLPALLAVMGLGLLAAALAVLPPAVGLPPWPPVLSQTLAGALAGDVEGVLVGVAISVILALRDLPGVLLAVLTGLLALLALVRPNPPRNAVVWTALAGILLPLLCGSTGWFQETAPLALAVAAYLLQLRRPAAAPLALLALFGWSHGASSLWSPMPAPPPQALAPGSDPGGTGPDPPRAPSSDGTP